MKSKYKILVAALMGSTTLFSGSLMAQEAQGDEAAQDRSVIIVSATRTGGTDLQTTPIAITALDAGQLEANNVSNLEDLQVLVPGLVVGGRSAGGSAFGQIAIRGVGVDAEDGSAAVGVYVDEVFFPSARGNILGLMDVAQVEVLRGPQGTLFGRNSLSGAILYQTRSPGDETEGYINATVGNFERRELEGAATLRLSDTFGLRFAGRYDKEGGFVDVTGTDQRLGGVESTALRGKALWEPVSGFSVELKAEWIDQEGNGRPGIVTEINPNAFFPTVLGPVIFGLPTEVFDPADWNQDLVSPGDYETLGYDSPDGFEFDGTLFQATIEYEVSDALTIKSISAKTDFDATVNFDADSTLVNLVAQQEIEKTSTFSQELQLFGSLADDRLRYTVGGYYFNSQRDALLEETLFGVIPSRNLDQAQITETESMSIYSQLSYDLTDRLTATVGLRLTDETVDFTAFGPGIPTFTQSTTFNDTSPYFGLDFEATPDLFLYARASKGFRAGGLSYNFDEQLANEYEPDVIWTYEAGMKLQTFEDRLRLNTAVFFSDWTDIQFLSPVVVGNTPTTLTDNAGDAELFGVEVEGQFAITDSLNFVGSLAFLDSHYTRVNPGGNVLLTTDLARAPEWKFTVGLNHTLRMNSGQIVSTVNYAWTDDQQDSARDGALIIESYGLLNGRISYVADNGWHVSLFGNNLTDERYFTSGLAGGSFFEVIGSNTVYLGRPRSYGVEVGIEF